MLMRAQFQNFRDHLKSASDRLRRQFVVSIGWATTLHTLINNMEGLM